MNQFLLRNKQRSSNVQIIGHTLFFTPTKMSSRMLEKLVLKCDIRTIYGTVCVLWTVLGASISNLNGRKNQVFTLRIKLNELSKTIQPNGHNHARNAMLQFFKIYSK